MTNNTALCACVYVAESSHAAETAWENSLTESLEKEVQDARKMVSVLQVHAYASVLSSVNDIFLLTSKLKFILVGGGIICAGVGGIWWDALTFLMQYFIIHHSHQHYTHQTTCQL